MMTLLITTAFAVALTVIGLLVLNLTQKKKKLMPEFINGKPTIAFFWADDKRCKEMSLIVEKIKENFRGSVKVLNFNVTKEHNMAENYLILNVPTIILFDKDGNQVIKITETKNFSKIESKLKEII